MNKNRQKARRWLVATTGFVALAATFLGAAAGSTASPFSSTFDGSPASPQPFTHLSTNEWDIQIQSRDTQTWYQLETMNAQHGADCSAPPASRAISAYEEAVFQCRNHMMTAIGSSGYGVIYLTPNQMFDFSNGGSITFEMSTERAAGARDWFDIIISPYSENLAVPLISDLSQGTDLNGYGRNLIHVATDNGEGAPRLKVVNNGVASCPSQCGFTPSLHEGIPDSVNQASTRQTFKFTVANGRMKFERLASATAPALVYWDNAATVNFTSGVVQFGHHTYNPTKDGGGPGTRHWDNFQFSAATPFTMIKADRRFVDSASQTLTFNSAAPSNSFLRFAAVGQISLSLDGGPFTVVKRQASVGDTFHADHMSSYFVPVPQGTRSVRVGFAPEGGYNGPFMAKDFAIWSTGGSTTTPTNPPQPPQPPNTPVPPTATPTTAATQSATPTITPAVPSNLNRITWNGKSWYLHGANLPWYNWGCDFGCGANGGASSSTVNSAVSAAFAQAKANGMNVVRWWVFPGDPWQITRATDGTPAGINPAVYTDLDAAVALAAQHDIYLDLVLFSAPSVVPQGWINNSAQRAKLAEVLGQMFARYKNNPRVMTWEVVNEPEWDIWSGAANQASVQAHVKAIADSIHANSPALVTVGSAMMDGLGMWVGQGLDYYQPHWYDYMQPGQWCARCTDFAAAQVTYGLDKPLVIGEFYAATSVDALQRYEDFRAKGYAGAWGWSLIPGRTQDGMGIDLSAARRFAAAYTDIGPKGAATPPPTATPTPAPPTATPTPAPPTATPTQVPATATPTKPAATSTPTKPVATSTPTTPAPTATPTAAATAFTATATKNKSSVTRGSTIGFTLKVKSATKTSALVNLEVYAPDGKKVYQSYFDNQSFRAGQTKTWMPNWRVPASAAKGTYTVKVGVFAPGWGTLYLWNDSATTFTVR